MSLLGPTASLFKGRGASPAPAPVRAAALPPPRAGVLPPTHLHLLPQKLQVEAKKKATSFTMDYDTLGLDDDDEDVELSAVPKKKVAAKKGDGAKKKPKAGGGGKAGAARIREMSSASSATGASKAKTRASAPVVARRPPAPAAGGGFKPGNPLSDPLSVNFGDSDISMSDLEGDVEFDTVAAQSEDDAALVTPPDAASGGSAGPKCGGASSLAAAKSLLSGASRGAVVPQTARPLHAASAAAPAPPRSASAGVLEDSFERELAAELSGPEEYSMGFEADDSPKRSAARAAQPTRPSTTAPPTAAPPAAPFAAPPSVQPAAARPAAVPTTAKLAGAGGRSSLLSAADLFESPATLPVEAPPPTHRPSFAALPTAIAPQGTVASAAKAASVAVPTPHFTPAGSLPRDALPPQLPAPPEPPRCEPYYESHHAGDPPPHSGGAAASMAPSAWQQAALAEAVARAERAEALLAVKGSLSEQELAAKLAHVRSHRTHEPYAPALALPPVLSGSLGRPCPFATCPRGLTAPPSLLACPFPARASARAGCRNARGGDSTCAGRRAEADRHGKAGGTAGCCGGRGTCGGGGGYSSGDGLQDDARRDAARSPRGQAALECTAGRRS